MFNIGNCFSGGLQNREKYKPVSKHYGGNPIVSDTFEKTPEQKRISFGAFLNAAEQKRFIEIMAEGGKEAEQILASFSLRQKEVAMLRYPAEGRGLPLKSIAEKLSIPLNDVCTTLSIIGEKFQKFISANR